MCAMVPTSIKSNEHHLNDEERKLLLDSGCEAVCIDTQLELSRYRFITIYRPPSTLTDVHDRSINLSNFIAKLTHPQYSTIIAGDFNLPKINWHANKYPNDGLHDVMYDCLSSLGFVQFVEEATHVTCNGSNNILDLVFCNDPVGLDINSIEAPISNSDHNLIKFSVFSSSIGLSRNLNDTCINLTSYDWSKANYEAINETLLSIDWHSIFGYFFEADTLWSQIKTVLWPIIALHVPHKIIPHYRKYRPRSYPKKIRNLLSRKSCLWRQLKISSSPSLFLKYRNIANECKLEIIKFDTQREDKLISANNLGAFYRFVNNKIGDRSGIAPLKNNENTLITLDCDKANLLNEYFESVFTDDDGSQPHFPSRLQNDCSGISDIRISPEIVFQVLKKCKTNSAAGPTIFPQSSFTTLLVHWLPHFRLFF